MLYILFSLLPFRPLKGTILFVRVKCYSTFCVTSTAKSYIYKNIKGTAVCVRIMWHSTSCVTSAAKSFIYIKVQLCV